MNRRATHEDIREIEDLASAGQRALESGLEKVVESRLSQDTAGEGGRGYAVLQRGDLDHQAAAQEASLEAPGALP